MQTVSEHSFRELTPEGNRPFVVSICPAQLPIIIWRDKVCRDYQVWLVSSIQIFEGLMLLEDERSQSPRSDAPQHCIDRVPFRGRMQRHLNSWQTEECMNPVRGYRDWQRRCHIALLSSPSA